MELSICVLSINRDVSLSQFDEILKHGGLRSLKYGGDFGITQSVLPIFERNSHIVRQIKAVNDGIIDGIVFDNIFFNLARRLVGGR